MNSRVVLFFVTLLALALFVSASPVPNADAAVVKKQLKQYSARAGVPKRRRGEPSLVYRAAAPDPTA